MIAASPYQVPKSVGALAISGGRLQSVSNESAWHSAGSMGWSFPVLKYKYISEIKYAETISSNSTHSETVVTVGLKLPKC